MRKRIEASLRLKDHLEEWGDAGIVLSGLKKQFPSNTERAHVLAKASAIDKLYSTRAGNIYWIANAVVDAMNEIEHKRADGQELGLIQVVDLISSKKQRLYKDSRRCASFASKYCHFFVEGEFLIYDSFALAAVKNLLGGTQRGLTPQRSEYKDFCERVDRLVNSHHLANPVSEIDCYLWLWGQWILRERGINKDVEDLFSTSDPAIKKDLDIFIGT